MKKKYRADTCGSLELGIKPSFEVEKPNVTVTETLAEPERNATRMAVVRAFHAYPYEDPALPLFWRAALFLKAVRPGTSAKGAPPVKKAAVPSNSSTTPKAVAVKKEAKPVVKDAKSDSSFFSKPKPMKKEMPSFKKIPPAAAAPVKKEPDPNVAQPSSFNPFEEVLKSLTSGARWSYLPVHEHHLRPLGLHQRTARPRPNPRPRTQGLLCHVPHR